MLYNMNNAPKRSMHKPHQRALAQIKAHPLSQKVKRLLPDKSSKIPMIIGGAFGLILLLSGVVYAGSLLFTGFSPVSKPAIQSNVFEKNAHSIDDFAVACQQVTSITNASYYKTKPHKIVLFTSSVVSDDNFIQSTVALSDKSWLATDADLTQVQLVGCLKRTAPILSKQCPYIIDGKKQDIGFYSATYEFRVVDARNSSQVRLSTAIPARAETCPDNVQFSSKEPKVFASPDGGAIERALAGVMG